MTGEEGDTKVHFKELFSETFTKHSREERDELFTCGAIKTTPAEKDMISNWPRPWLYIRVLGVILLLVTVILNRIKKPPFGKNRRVRFFRAYDHFFPPKSFPKRLERKPPEGFWFESRLCTPDAAWG